MCSLSAACLKPDASKFQFTFVQHLRLSYLLFLSASKDPLLKDFGIAADNAAGCCLQEVHRAVGQREVRPCENGQVDSFFAGLLMNVEGRRFLICSKIFLCSQEPDVDKLQKKINCGQIEEVIFQVASSYSDD